MFARFALLLSCIVLAPVIADQNDRRLEPLFERLQHTDDGNEAQRVTQQIWTIWYEVADAETSTQFRTGVEHMAGARYPEALAAFDRVVELQPGFAEGWNRRATVLYLMGDYPASVDDIKRTLALEPRHFGALSGLGLIYLRGEHWEDAISAFEKALEINPHMPGPRLNIEMIKEHNRSSTI